MLCVRVRITRFYPWSSTLLKIFLEIADKKPQFRGRLLALWWMTVVMSELLKWTMLCWISSRMNIWLNCQWVEHQGASFSQWRSSPFSLSPLLLYHPQQLSELGLTKHPFVLNEHIKAFTKVCTRMYTDKLCRPCWTTTRAGSFSV